MKHTEYVESDSSGKKHLVRRTTKRAVYTIIECYCGYRNFDGEVETTEDYNNLEDTCEVCGKVEEDKELIV